MELKKLQQYWNSFPEVSMEERPVLSTDLEKIVVKNPLSDAFYLRNKILIRIVLGVLLLAMNIYQLQQEVHNNGNDQDRQVIDRLWNPFIAAWYDGKDDPKLVLLRFDAEHAEVWLNESNLVAGVKMLFGADPKKDYRDKVGDVDLQ